MADRLVHGYNRLDVTPGNHFASVNNNPRKDPCYGQHRHPP